MNVLLLGGTQDFAVTVRTVLRIRWQDTALFHIPLAHIDQWREAMRRDEPTLVLIDCTSDVPTCCDLIAQIRAFSDVPLVMIGQGEDVTAEVQALETGADDWIDASTIPMDFIARVNALLRRYSISEKQGLKPYTHGSLSIDFATQEVRISGRQVALTPTEFKVLCVLARHEGTLVTHESLLANVWGTESYSDPEFVKKYVHRLRTKLEEDPAEPNLIVTRRGAGYVFAPGSSIN